MNYKATCIAVKDIKAARLFYENLFDLEVEFDFGINISFTCGLALQENFSWLTGIDQTNISKKGNQFELYFEEVLFDDFLTKLAHYPNLDYLHPVKEHSFGQRVIRFYDLDGHLIEVGEDLKSVVQRFLNQGLSFERIAQKMNITTFDIENILNR